MRVPFLIFWAVTLSAFTAILGATPLRVLRRIVGQGPFWLICVCLIGLSVGLSWHSFALIFGVNTILVGCFSEFEERDFSLRQAAGFAIFITALLLSSGVYIWSALVGKMWFTQIVSIVESLLVRAQTMNMELLKEITAQDIVMQLPSAVFIYMIIALGLSLILESRASRLASAPMGLREKLTNFSAPDVVVWVFIVSLLGTFAKFGLKPVEVISINALNICLVIYFFQGLAVLGTYFEASRISATWRVLWVLLLVIQLPVLMSLLGLVDYWADFRKALVKRAAQLKKKRIQD